MEFVQFIVNLYTCITVFLSSELLSNVFFLFFFTNAFICQDVMINKHLLFSIFYLKKSNLSVILLSIREQADGENWKL